MFESIPIPRPLRNIYFEAVPALILGIQSNYFYYYYGVQVILRHKGIGSLPSATSTVWPARMTELADGETLVGMAQYNAARATTVRRISSTLFIWGSLLCAYFYAPAVYA